MVEVSADSPFSNVLIIMLTAKSDTEDVVKAWRLAPTTTLPPFKHAELLARIRTRLRPRESRQLVVSIGRYRFRDMDGRQKYQYHRGPDDSAGVRSLAALVRPPRPGPEPSGAAGHGLGLHRRERFFW